MESLTVATWRLSSTEQTGIGHYIDRIVAGLRARQDIDEVTVLETRRRQLELGRLRVGGQLSRLWDLTTQRVNADVVHGSHIPFAHARSTALMIHDAVWATRPHEYPDTGFFVKCLRRRIRNLPLVMSPSQASADDVQAALALKRTPTVVHLAPDHDVFYEGDVEKQGYALYAGSCRPRKGLAPMVKAAAAAGLGIVRCGPQYPHEMVESQKLHDLALQCGTTYRDVGYVSRADLRELYAGAEVLMYAGEEEGFGLPPFEAAACGTQSVLSPLPVFKELWPEGLAQFSDNGLVEAFQAAVDEPVSSGRLVQHAKKFTWDATVDGHVKAWRAVLNRQQEEEEAMGELCMSPSCDGCKWCLPLPRGAF